MHNLQNTTKVPGSELALSLGCFLFSAWMAVASHGAIAAEAVGSQGRELTYVESRGGEQPCFDTHVPMTPTTRIVMDFQYPVNPGADGSCFFGQSYFKTGFMWGARGGCFAFHSPTAGYHLSSVPVDTSRHVFDIANGSQKLDGAEIATLAYGSEGSTISSVYLFAYLNGYMGYSGHGNIRLFSCQIYEGETMVRNYVPWTRDGVVGLYDKVNASFSFCFSRGQLMGPVFEDVEYVESTGNEYIDTGVVPTSETRIEQDCQYLDFTSSDRWFQGIYGSATTTDYEWGVDSGWFKFYNNTSAAQFWSGNRKADTERHVFSLASGSQKIDGVECGTAKLGAASQGGANETMFLFARRVVSNNNAPKNNAKMRLYACQIYEGDALIRDYRPCTSNGVVGVMETVSSNFVALTYNVGLPARTIHGGMTNLIDCAYVETTSSEFIDMGVSPTADLRMVLDGRFMSLPGKNTRLLAGVNDNTHDFAWGIDGNGKFVTYMYNGLGWQAGPDADTERHVWDMGPGLQKIDETVIATQTHRDTKDVWCSLFIGARQTFWSGPKFPAIAEPHAMRIYGCKFYKGEKLIHDFVPCFGVGTSGLRDRVTGIFCPMLSIDTTKRSRGIFAPFAGEALKYVESTGSQYVDLEASPSLDLKVELDCQYRNVTSRQLNGYNSLGTDFAWGVDGGKFRTYSWSSSSAVWLGDRAADTLRHVFSFENEKQMLDGADYTRALMGGATDETMFLFARRCSWHPRVADFGKMRFYGCKIYRGDQLIRDYVPMKVFGTPCLYDKVDCRPYLPHGGGLLYKEIPPLGLTLLVR